MEEDKKLVAGCNKIGGEIVDALGLKHVRCLDIHLPAGGMITVTAEIYPEMGGVKRFPAILKKYKLTETDSQELPGETSGETSCLGDEYDSYDFEYLRKKEGK